MKDQKTTKQGEEPNRNDANPAKAKAVAGQDSKVMPGPESGAPPGQDPEPTQPVDWQGRTLESDPENPVVESERPGESLHSPEPDERDEEKVERLAAPDWRSEQPLPVAQNAVDPRGENTPEELFEPPEQKKPE